MLKLWWWRGENNNKYHFTREVNVEESVWVIYDADVQAIRDISQSSVVTQSNYLFPYPWIANTVNIKLRPTAA